LIVAITKLPKCIRESEAANLKPAFSGDSYSQTGFDISGAKPSSSNPLGNPDLPGWTAAGGLNWVGLSVTETNASTLLSYNFAYGGATTDAALVTPYAPTVRSFADQVGIFTGSLGVKPRPAYAQWNADNALAAVWIGVNDVGNSFENQNSTIVADLCADRYFQLVREIYKTGVRKFVFLTVPRMSFTSYTYQAFCGQ
jgi:hypothetical protein